MPEKNSSAAEKQGQASSPQAKNSVYKKLLAVMKEVEYIRKDKTNEQFKYKYASEETIKKTVRKAFIKEGIVFNIEVKNLRFEPRPNKSDGLTYVDIQYFFTDIDTLDQLTGTFVGTGYDTLDKGVWKAITGAIKYILTSVLLIPTGDDPEGGKEPEDDKNKTKTKKTTTTTSPKTEPEPGNGQTETMISKSQNAKIHALIKEKKWDDSYVKFQLQHHFKIDSVKDLTMDNASKFIKLLLADDTDEKQIPEAGTNGMITGKQKKRIGELYKKLEWEASNMQAVLDSYNADSRKDLTEKQAKEVIAFMEDALKEMEGLDTIQMGESKEDDLPF